MRCLERAERTMADESRAAGERVHEARVALKRARAVLRIGDVYGFAWTKLARLRLARLAGALAAARDAAVVAATAQHLGLATETKAADAGISWVSWVENLTAEQQRLADCPWPVLTRNDCVAALAESVCRLRRRERAARRGAAARRLHEWRKTVIVLREQLNVLRPLLTPGQQTYAPRLHRLARKLGAAQDLALLIAAERSREPSAARSLLLVRAIVERGEMVRRVRRLARGLPKALRRKFAVSDRATYFVSAKASMPTQEQMRLRSP